MCGLAQGSSMVDVLLCLSRPSVGGLVRLARAFLLLFLCSFLSQAPARSDWRFFPFFYSLASASGSPLAVGAAAAEEGRLEYEGIRRQAASARSEPELSCWSFVAEEVEKFQVDTCGELGEGTRELLGLAKAKCLHIRTGWAFPDQSDGCFIDADQVPSHVLKQFTKETDAQQKTENEETNSEIHPGSAANPCTASEGEVLTLVGSDERARAACQRLKRWLAGRCMAKGAMSFDQLHFVSMQRNHIDSMCHYMTAEAWNRRTEANISKLSSTAGKVAEHMARQLFDLERIQVIQQHQMEGGERLQSQLSVMHTGLSEVFDILMVLLDFIKAIRGALGSCEAILFYAALVVVAYFASIHTSVAPVRGWLLLLLAVGGATEKVLVGNAARLAALWMTSNSLAGAGPAAAASRWTIAEENVLSYSISLLRWVGRPDARVHTSSYRS
eukprot:GHVT01099820.1.p1 GENE.GHVT01099820.1~~GHVT01099820.1.p1  ORF type:complete len:443 (+),score=91.73 GHVT01099820.1:539-1867(+)